MTADAGTFTSRHKIQLGLGSNNNDAWMLMIKYANYNATVGRRCFQRYEIFTAMVLIMIVMMMVTMAMQITMQG